MVYASIGSKVIAILKANLTALQYLNGEVILVPRCEHTGFET